MDPEDVQAWVTQLQQHYAPESVRTKLHALKSLLSYAQRMGYLRYNDGCRLRVSEACGLDWGGFAGARSRRAGHGLQQGAQNAGGIGAAQALGRADAASVPGQGGVCLAQRAAFGRTRVHRIIKAAARAAEITPAVSAHWLRHAHATIAI